MRTGAAKAAATALLASLLAACGGSDSGTPSPGGAPAPSGSGEWSTFQGNAGHTGFVDADFDPAAFTKAWSWSRPAGDAEPIGGINSVAAGGGKVFVTKDIYFGQGSVYALNESDGSMAWTYDLGPMASEGPPAYADGRVIVPSTDQSSNCVMWAVDAAAGLYRYRMPTSCQWSSFFAPTVLGDAVLQTAQTGIVHSFSTVDGAVRWSATAGAYDQATPAVDASLVYQYGSETTGGPALRVFNRATGAQVASIGDPFSTSFNGYSIFGAPMLASSGRVIAFSGGGFSGRAASSSEQYASRVLVAYDIAARKIAWRSAYAYLAHPATANGVVYTARNAPASFDALAESDGHLLWSWTPPVTGATFHRNVVITRNLAFVSTDTAVYAIDLATRRQVWQYPKPGMLAISASAMLYIVTGATLSDGQLDAIRLR